MEGGAAPMGDRVSVATWRISKLHALGRGLTFGRDQETGDGLNNNYFVRRIGFVAFTPSDCVGF